MTGTDRAPVQAATTEAPPPLARTQVGLITGAVALLLVATSGRYGYHRDELYYLVAGRHLAWGYDDQPPLVPLVARLADAVFPGSVAGPRLVSALAVAATVLLSELIARELGGGRRAQVVAAACAAVTPVLLIPGHMLSTTTFDILSWTALTWLVGLWVRTRDDRLCFAAGLVVGVGYLNKNLIAFLAAALAVALIADGGPGVRAALLRSRLLWAGAAIAVVLALPNVWWQAAHGWPQFEMAAVIRADADDGGRVGFLPMQILAAGPLLAPVWVAGLWRLLRNPGAREYRFFGWTYMILLAVFLVTGGRYYYMAGMLPVLLASGAIAVNGWLERAGWLRPRARARLLAVDVMVSAVITVLGLPVIPVDRLRDSPASYDVRETVGWPRFAETVAGVYRSLPEGERARAVLLTGNYGEAGALHRYGRALGLRPAFSGHNAFWRWGPPPDTGGPVVVAGRFPQSLDRYWGNVTLATRNDNGHGVENEEQGVPDLS
jgi:4-amino-4-deoxy-L-arabinose transferase-like glycosyltransferase